MGEESTPVEGEWSSRKHSLRMNAYICPSPKKVGKHRTLPLPGHPSGSSCRLGGARQTRVASTSPRCFLKRVWSPERGPFSPSGLNNALLPPLPFWNFSAAFLPTCFQFALVASSDCDLNQRLREKGDREGEGGPKRKRAEEVTKGARKGVEAGVRPLGKWLSALSGWFGSFCGIMVYPFCGS